MGAGLAVENNAVRNFDPRSMEGRQAIFTEKWIVALVKVHTIRVTDRWIKASICAIPTPGLFGINEIEIGAIHEYFEVRNEIWTDRGYCCWRVLFNKQVIDEVLRVASSFPKEWIYDPASVDFDTRFNALTEPIWKYAREEAPHPDLLYLNLQMPE